MEANRSRSESKDLALSEEEGERETLDAYQLSRFHQLETANKSNALFYSRDKYSSVLARKLKPEFAKFFVCSEAKDCQKVLARTSANKAEDQNVDVVLIDADKAAINLVKYINEVCPTIPVVMLLSENTEDDYVDLIKNVGDVNKIIKMPCKTKVILYAMIELLQIRQDFELPYNSLKTKRVVSSKYPYLPIFTNSSTINKYNASNSAAAAATAVAAKGEDESHSCSSLPSNMEEVDDGTDCSSLLPPFVKESRLADPKQFDHRLSTIAASGGIALIHSAKKNNKLSKQIDAKFDQLDEQINKEHVEHDNSPYDLASNGHHHLSSSEGVKADVLLLPSEDEGEERAERDRRIPLKRMKTYAGSSGALAVAEHFGGAVDDGFDLDNEDSFVDPDSPSRRIRPYSDNDDDDDDDDDDEDEAGEGTLSPNSSPGARGHHFGGPGGTTGGGQREKVLTLLDPAYRPVWNPGGKALTPVADDESLEDLAEEKHPNNDMYAFVNKVAPKLEDVHTVGGLNKRLADRHWRVLHRLSNDKVDVVMGKGLKNDPLGSCALPPVCETPSHHSIAKSSTASLLLLVKPSTAPNAAVTAGTIAASASAKPTTRNSFEAQPQGLMKRNSSKKLLANGTTSSSAKPMSPSMSKFKNAVGRVSRGLSVVNAAFDYERDIPPAEFIQQVDAAGRPLSRKQITALTVEAINKRTKETFHESKLAETNVMKLAKEKPYDIQVSNLIQIDLYNRKINLGERDLLEKGLKAEADGDSKSAVVCYTRAGSHSKDQHISKMLLGHLHYSRGKLMLALKYYSDAIVILTDRLVHSRIVNDEFAAYHNRGVVNFRLGNDDDGLKDIEAAHSLDPTHTATRELLSLAKRRMGKFNAAITDAIGNKAYKSEKKRADLMAAIEKQSERRVSVFLSGTKIDPRVALLERLTAEATTPAILKSEMVVSRKGSNNSVASAGSGGGGEKGAAGLGGGKVSFVDPKQSTGGPAEVYSRPHTSAPTPQSVLEGRIFATRGYVLSEPEYDCGNTLQDKIKEAKKMMRGGDGGGADEVNNGEGGFLKVFKLNHGYKMELFDELFNKPTELQECLLVEPHKRMIQHIEVISTHLRLFPFLRGLSDSLISDLANIVEYRALTTQDALFSQNMPASAMCMLLKGSIEAKMLNNFDSVSKDILLGELPQYSSFGYVDFLFRHRNQTVVKELENILYPKVSISSTLTGVNRYSTLGALGPTVVGGVTVGGTNNGNTNSNNGGGGSSNVGLKNTKWASMGDLTVDTSFIDSNTAEGGAAAAAGGNAAVNSPVHHHSTSECVLQKKLVSGEELDRSLSSGMFMSYCMHSMCELLMVGEKDFERILLSSALEDLKKRLEVIKSCCVFSSWTRDDHIRLARMGQVRTYKRGEVILQQGVKPAFLYIIMKGMCKVRKRPNRTEMLIEKLRVAKEKADRHDLLYTYHHIESKKLEKQPPSEGGVEGGGSLTGGGSSVLSLADSTDALINGGIIIQGSMTEAEYNRKQLALEIARLENLIQNATLRDMRENSALHGGGGGGGGTHSNGSGNTSHNNSMHQLPSMLAHGLTPLRVGSSSPTNFPKRSLLLNSAGRGGSPSNGSSTPSMGAMATDLLANSLRLKHSGGFVSPYDEEAHATVAAERLAARMKAAAAGTGKSFMNTGNSNSHNGANNDNVDSLIKQKVAEIAVLQWPMIFGEACVLDPENGVSKGSVVADTICDVFVLHKTQIQTFPVDDSFFERVKVKATLYPDDPDIVVSLYRKQEWKQYKNNVMEAIPKDRWPTKIVEYEPFNV